MHAQTVEMAGQAAPNFFENAAEARRLLVADSDPVVHFGITGMLAGSSWFKVAAYAKSGREAIALARAVYPDIVLLGLRLPGMLTERLIGQLRGGTPELKVVMFAPPPALNPAVAASIDGMLPRSADPCDLLDVLSRVARGRPPEGVLRGQEPRRHGLTRREHDILCRVALGETNAEVARALGLTTNTAKTYFQRALEKLGARNRVEAVVYATELGLL